MSDISVEFFPGVPQAPMSVPSVPYTPGLPTSVPSFAGERRKLKLRAKGIPAMPAEPVKRIAVNTCWINSFDRTLVRKQIVFTVGKQDHVGRECIMNIAHLNETFAKVYGEKLEEQDREITEYDMIPEDKVMLQEAGSECGRQSWVDRSSSWIEQYKEQIMNAPESAFRAGITAQDRKTILDSMIEVEKEEDTYVSLLKAKTRNLQKGVMERRSFETMKGVAEHVRYAGLINNIQAQRQMESQFAGQTMAIAIGSWYADVSNTFNTQDRLEVGTPLFVYLTRHFDSRLGKYTAFKLVTWGDKEHESVPLSMMSYVDDSGNLQQGKSWLVGRIQFMNEGRKVGREKQLQAIGLSGGLTSEQAIAIMSSLQVITVIQGVS